MTTEPRVLSSRQWLLVLLVALAALLPGQFQIPAMDRDEARYAQASRQMLETGDFVDIRFQEVPRHVKPIGTYWLQAATASLAGGAEAGIWAYRLPSLLGALAIVALTAAFTASIAGAGAGVAAGLLMGVALITGVEARTAKTDALLVTAILLAQIGLHRIATRPEEDSGFLGGGWRSPAAFWLFHGIGVLIKGPIITLVVATTALAWAAWNRDWGLLRRLRILPGLLVTIAVVAPWLVAITMKVGPAFLEEAVGHALLGKVAKGDDSHGAPPGYHTLALLLVFWPGTFLLAGAVLLSWKRRAESDVGFLICWIVPTFLVFELVATKLPHYAYPTYPAIAALAALALVGGMKEVAAGGARWAHRLVIGLGLVLTVVLAAVPLGAQVHLTGGFDLGGVLASLAGLVALFFAVRFVRDITVARLAPLMVAACGFYALTFAVVAPSLNPLWISRAVHSHVPEITGCERVTVVSAGFSEPSMVFVNGTHTVLSDGERAPSHLDGCAVAVVERRQHDAFMAAMGDRTAALSEIARVQGLNYSRGRDIDLRLYRLNGG